MVEPFDDSTTSLQKCLTSPLQIFHREFGMAKSIFEQSRKQPWVKKIQGSAGQPTTQYPPHELFLVGLPRCSKNQNLLVRPQWTSPQNLKILSNLKHVTKASLGENHHMLDYRRWFEHNVYSLKVTLPTFRCIPKSSMTFSISFTFLSRWLFNYQHFALFQSNFELVFKILAFFL